MVDRQRTHADDCWSWGPGHYDCAVREIERLRGALEECHALSVARWRRLLEAEAVLAKFVGSHYGNRQHPEASIVVSIGAVFSRPR